MRRYKCLFFDLGDVLVNVHMDRLFRNFSMITDIPLGKVQHEIKKINEPYLAFQKGQLSKSDYFELLRKKFDLDVDDQILEQTHCDIFSLNSELLEFVRSIEGDYCFSIISNTDELHFNYILDSFHELDFFIKNTTSYEAGCLKPDEQIYTFALEKNSANPEQCLFVDDRVENVAGAQKLGITALHFQSVNRLRADFKNLGV